MLSCLVSPGPQVLVETGTLSGAESAGERETRAAPGLPLSLGPALGMSLGTERGVHVALSQLEANHYTSGHVSPCHPTFLRTAFALVCTLDWI